MENEILAWSFILKSSSDRISTSGDQSIWWSTLLTTWNLDLVLCTFLCFDDHMTRLTLIGQFSEVKLPIMCLITFCKFCRQKQSSKQILALTILISAAVLLSVGESSSKGSKGGSSDYVLLYGIIPVTVASMLSGLASSLCQWASQVKKHTSYMMTIEMSFIGSMCMLASTYRSPDGEAIRKYGFFHEWTLWTVVSTLWYSIVSPLAVG